MTTLRKRYARVRRAQARELRRGLRRWERETPREALTIRTVHRGRI